MEALYSRALVVQHFNGNSYYEAAIYVCSFLVNALLHQCTSTEMLSTLT